MDSSQFDFTIRLFGFGPHKRAPTKVAAFARVIGGSDLNHPTDTLPPIMEAHRIAFWGSSMSNSVGKRVAWPKSGGGAPRITSDSAQCLVYPKSGGPRILC